MNEVLQTNVFFVITGISVIILTIFIGVLLYYAIRLVRILARLAQVIEHEAGEYVELSSDIRERISDHPLIKMFVGTTRARTSKRANNK